VIGLVSAGAGVVVTVLVLVGFGALGGRDRSPILPPVVTSPNSPIDYSVAQRVAASAGPSIVTVNADTTGPDGRTSRTQGSGVVLRTDRVITSAHLVNGATKVEVSTKQGDTFTATVIGVDPSTDLCSLLVEGIDPSLPIPELVDEPVVGDVVIALGAGRANEGWTSTGVVQERNLIASYGGAPAVPGLLATSTGTTAATTGGGLFDPDGRIIGILVTMPGGPRDGLAVPIDVALNVAAQLERDKTARHGALGVVFGTDTGGRTPGATVAGTVPDGPAARADTPLQAGDVIIRVGDTRVRSWADAVAAARQHQPTEQIELTVLRGRSTIAPRLQLGTAGDTVVDATFGPIG
jgi:S1-C subfamily serine protease